MRNSRKYGKEEKQMRRLLALAAFGAALSLFGYAAAETVPAETEAVKPLIKCSTCGVEFTSQAGLTDHVKAHPEHAAATESGKVLIKCSTCGTEFTSQAGVEEHIKSHPGHVMAPTSGKGLVKCSTCGVEFTAGAGVEDHLKSHPGHVMEPAE
ncbi:hypothetical protein EG829_02775 [bacterium]|nr:hypothetical protein [bacterium]